MHFFSLYSCPHLVSDHLHLEKAEATVSFGFVPCQFFGHITHTDGSCQSVPRRLPTREVVRDVLCPIMAIESCSGDIFLYEIVAIVQPPVASSLPISSPHRTQILLEASQALLPPLLWTCQWLLLHLDPHSGLQSIRRASVFLRLCHTLCCCSL